jgi:N utilization substance protein B
MDRAVLRIGVYELMFEDGVPPKVAINEAVELAKAFGGENSSKFVNGVLGTVLRQLEEKPKKAAQKKKSAKA